MEQSTGSPLDVLIQGAPTELDLTDREHLAAVRSMAESLLESSANLDALRDLERGTASDPNVPVSLGVAAKLALSRALLGQIDPATHVSVVFAVYKEHQRILTAEEHPAGEDFLRQKLAQLRWLFDPTPRHSWDLTVVDDGCPEGSGRMAQAVLDECAQDDEEARVLFLEDAIREQLPIVGTLQSTSESQKGGAIRLGLWHAAQNLRGPSHIAVFTDADLSTHLGQIGLLAAACVAPDCMAAIGSRREPTSIVMKAATRNVRGKLFIYLWKRLIPELQGIVDTQCGFKAFDAHHMGTWIGKMRDAGFSFDIEALMRVNRDRPGSIRKVPIAWIDSELASTTADLEPYLPMLKSVADIYRRALPPTATAEPFAELIERLNEDSFQAMIGNAPAEIAGREPIEFDDYSQITAADLARAAGLH